MFLKPYNYNFCSEQLQLGNKVIGSSSILFLKTGPLTWELYILAMGLTHSDMELLYETIKKANANN